MDKITRCKNCGKLFRAREINQKYCAPCRTQIAYYVPKNEVEKTCVNCGKTFKTKYSRQKFCTTTCNNEYHKIKQNLHPVKCGYRKCTNTFVTTKKNKKFCSSEHYYEEKLCREQEQRKNK